VFDLSTQTWSNKNLANPPAARSGFSFMATEHNCVLFGGYSAHEKASSSSGGSGSKGTTYSDVWVLKMGDDGPVAWEKQRTGAGLVPSVRSGTSMIHFKNKVRILG
jgi:hypothetical protein